MKKILIPLVAGCVLSCAQPSAAQEFKTHVSKEFTVQKGASATVLSIYNIFGSVKVEGYAGDKVIMEIDQTISAKSNEVLEEGKKEFQLAFDQQSDTIMAYIAAPYDSRPHENYGHWNDRRRIEYKYTLEFTVKVPYNMNLNVSTVNNGNVLVKDVGGSLRVSNVNGAITVANAKSGKMHIHTINGDVTVNHLAIPDTESSYYTLNGRLEVTYPSNLSADLEFKSMNGSFYTDFPDAEILPGRVTKTQEKKADGTVYKLNKNSDLRIGGGGKTFKFETLNGNIYIKKQS
ncbi:MAG: hypothetical protein JWQ78_1794 [Sediminibacterium sp.]|nr:hypothetical protein [Sediminibacterium sp.]